MRGVRPGEQTWRAACGLIASASLAASCTLLVQFHDEGSCEGGLCGDAAAAIPDVTVPEPDGGDGDASSAPEAGGTTDAGAASSPDGGHDAAPPAPCKGLANGYYCAHDGLNQPYPGSPDDLVECVDGGEGILTTCDGGCLPLPAPFPDACNPCVAEGDGLYCGRDLAGFPASNADFLIQCQAGNTAQDVACAHGCKSSGTSSSCYP
jgi:hypothetical protein